MINNKIFFSFQTTRSFSWSAIRLWCVTWLHSGHDDMNDDLELCSSENRCRALGYGQAFTQTSEEIPSTSTATRCDSATQSNSPKTDNCNTSVAFRKFKNPCKTGKIDDSVS